MVYLSLSPSMVPLTASPLTVCICVSVGSHLTSSPLVIHLITLDTFISGVMCCISKNSSQRFVLKVYGGLSGVPWL